jgi:type II restriction/modification system DNA methylase subunit YeeA/REP element-mobilizing transposase RayT
MSLFQNSVLNKYLKGLESEKVTQAYERFISHFHNPTIQKNIRNSKEEQYQGEFLIDLFVNVLGYVKNPTPDFNLTTELKNIKGSKKTDGAILKENKALAVIELKGTNTTDLSKVETQAFGYKNNQLGCNYVITSNFEKLRFYIDNAVDFEEFNLFQLTKERFNILWLCLSAEYLLKDIPKKIKNESLTQEENITKKLYKDYASFRNEIFDNIQKENPQYDKLTLFKKTQKLLDRFLFIFFAEDRLLLPPNSIRSIVNQWIDLRDKYDEYFPLYDRFKKYFGYMNTGYKGQQHDIFAYNGGLFAPDDILDNIKINDDLLYKHTLNLSNYDFESEVSVNILGHIFEHSLNDIDQIQAEIQGAKTDKSKTKRKKDGVFYTPKYITKYIVDNTVGKLCEEKKAELNIQETEYEKERKGRKKTTLKKLAKNLEDYRKWLLQITICDPACGSGAFLNQALEFLIAEHRYIDELQAKLFGDAMVLSEVENSILENNLFGVDINEESVDIAKLSLWLRTAQKGRKLTSLNNNIKCGNSLIDNPKIAGDKAFNWEKEFPQVFKDKVKKPHHITWVTHNSRTSQRMIDHKVKKGDALWLSDEWELNITKTIGEIIKQDNLNVLAYNICGDHIHLLLVCEDEEVSNIVRKLKGKSSQKLKEYLQIPKEEQFTLWAQKYSNTYIDTEKKLNNTISYIQTNREKHKLPNNKGLQPLVDNNKGLQPLVDKMCCSINHAFRPEKKGGFDVVIGNPPYVQLQKMKELSSQIKKLNYKTYESTGDLYCLFYELGNELLKHKGILGFITSNKWMRANYGKSLRKYFYENTTPYKLIDLGAGIFEGAVVDSNIIMFKKEKAKEFTIPSLNLTKEQNVKDFTIYHNKFVNIYPQNDDVWTISSKEEQNIKAKIEKLGTPLKDWNIEINRGILTGLTDAFIINRNKKDELIKTDPKSAEIIKPVLRGRDIKRYTIDYQDLYLINSHNGYDNVERINIDDYPAIKEHLLQFEPQLSKRYDKGKTPFNLRNCAYIDAFGKSKIIWKEMSSETPFVLDNNGYFTNDTITFIVGENLYYLLSLLNSKLFFYLFSNYYSGGGLGNKGVRFKKDFLSNVPLIIIPKTDFFANKAKNIQLLNFDFQKILNQFLKYLQSQFNIEKPSKKLQNWHELEFAEFIKELNKSIKKANGEKLSKKDEMEWMELFEEKKAEAQALKTKIEKTDSEIDQMVYELYGLTKDEIKIVEQAIT